MRMSAAIDEFVADMWADGRFSSALTERSYRDTLARHVEDVGNRDPRTVGHPDVTRTLRRWTHPNTRGVHRSHLVSFYDWAMETGLRKDNPARQTRRPRSRKATVYRLTRDEVRSFRSAARPGREQAIADFGVLTGLRAQELLGLQGRHLRRPGWVWVSDDIAKGPKGRWVPVLPELESTFELLAEAIADAEFVLPNRQHQIRGAERHDIYDLSRPMGYESLYRAVGRIGKTAGISARVTPHMMRHAYGDHIARYAGLKVAQFVLGHAAISTTEGYTGAATLDEVANALREFGYGERRLPTQDQPSTPLAVAGGRFGVDYGDRGPVRDPIAVELAPVLRWLFCNPTFRRVAKEMALHA